VIYLIRSPGDTIDIIEFVEKLHSGTRGLLGCRSWRPLFGAQPVAPVAVTVFYKSFQPSERRIIHFLDETIKQDAGGS